MSEKQKVFLPCKIGERFIPKEFVKWENGRRIYKDSLYEEFLLGVDCYFCHTRCLSIPVVVCKSGKLLEYDELPDEQGGGSKMYEPKYFINVSQLTFTKRDGRIYDSPFVHVREWNEEYNPVQEVKEEQNGQMMFVFT